MTPQLANVAKAFHIGALTLGIPAFIALLPLSFFALQMYFTRPAPMARMSSSSDPPSLISLLDSGLRIVGKAASFLGDMAQAFVTGLALLSFALTLVAVLMFYTSRGLIAGATWARIAAIMICVMALGIGFVGSFAMRLPLSLAMYALFAGSAYSLWVLATRFSI